jgi:hypothetical protein
MENIMIDKIRKGKPPKNTKDIGDVSEMKIIAKLTELGHNMSTPIGDNLRYDLILDIDNALYRIQIKTGRYKDGSMKFATCSNGRCNGDNIWYNYKKQIDYFAIYCPELDSCYVISVDDVPDTECSLRIDPPKNNQKKGITWAKDFVL